jgi:hypothetical protein
VLTEKHDRIQTTKISNANIYFCWAHSLLHFLRSKHSLSSSPSLGFINLKNSVLFFILFTFYVNKLTPSVNVTHRFSLSFLFPIWFSWSFQCCVLKRISKAMAIKHTLVPDRFEHEICETNNHLVTFYLLKPTGHYMYHQFNIQQLYVLPTQYLCVLYLSENKQRLVPLTA